MWTKSFISGFCVVLFLSACGSNETNMKMSSFHLEQISDETTERVQVLRKEMDSLCVLEHDQLLDQVVDSLLTLRREQERVLREKYSQ